MSTKILSQAGISLADVYDVKGSVAGLDNLDVEDVKAVHELGAQIHSERLNSFVQVIDSGSLAQSAVFDIEVTPFPDSVHRILSVVVAADAVAHVNICSVSIHDRNADTDEPIWLWDNGNDVEGTFRSRIAGVTANLVALRPTNPVPGGVPNLLMRVGAEWEMASVFFRGQMLAFGAGTAQARALVLFARPNRSSPVPGDPSSHGLPFPSW